MGVFSWFLNLFSVTVIVSGGFLASLCVLGLRLNHFCRVLGWVGNGIQGYSAWVRVSPSFPMLSWRIPTHLQKWMPPTLSTLWSLHPSLTLGLFSFHVLACHLVPSSRRKRPHWRMVRHGHALPLLKGFMQGFSPCLYPDPGGERFLIFLPLRALQTASSVLMMVLGPVTHICFSKYWLN